MLNELFAREILETSIALGILQEMNGGVVIYHEASKEDPENLPAGWYIDDKDYTMFSIATDPEAIRELKPCLVEAGYQYEEREVLSGRYRTERCHRASRTVHRHPCAVFRQMILDLCVKKGEGK